MENPTNSRCGASSCSEPAIWRFAAAMPTEPAAEALARPDAELRCQLHMSLSALTWLPGLADGLVVVVGAADSPAAGRHSADTVRMASHLIDVDQLRPGRPDVPPSVTVTETAFMRVVRPVPARLTVDVGEVVVPGQLFVPGTDR